MRFDGQEFEQQEGEKCAQEGEMRSLRQAVGVYCRLRLLPQRLCSFRFVLCCSSLPIPENNNRRNSQPEIDSSSFTRLHQYGESDYNHSPNYSQTGGGASACGLAALNCARVVLGIHAAGLGTPQLVDSLTKRPFLERCLRHTGSSYGKAGVPYFKEMLTEILGFTKQHSRTTCVIITRPPEILACFCIADLPSDLFVVFDSHPRPNKHPHGAAFIFKNSVDVTAEHLAEVLHYDEHLLKDSALQWQAQLLSHCSGDVFVAPDITMTDSYWSELALDASLQMLAHQARVRELESANERLEIDNKALKDEVSNTEDRLSELDDDFERLKRKYTKLKKTLSESGGAAAGPSAGLHNHRSADLGYSQSPIGTTLTRHAVVHVDTNAASNAQASSHWPAHKQANDGDLAFNLQRQFDEEDQELQRQHRFLQDTQPAIFECGICFDRLQEDFVVRLMPCSHTMCRQCAKAYAVSAIEAHRYPIQCPSCTAGQEQGDPSELDDAVVRQLGLTDKQYETYSEMQLARFSTIIHCRKCKETIFVDKVEYQETEMVAIQIGGPKHSCDGSTELQHLMGERGWKKCPGCETPTEKTEGCNHMTCMSPSCNTPAHLEVEDIHKVPIFQRSLHHVRSSYGLAEMSYFKELLSDLFVIFDSHPRPDKHPHGAAFIFKNSVDVTPSILLISCITTSIFSGTLLFNGKPAPLPLFGQRFTAPDTSMTDQNWSELALDASLQMLSLQARVRELETNNEALEADNKRYGRRIQTWKTNFSS
ncbi:uncharacterized protein BXZ73DRAFT_107364 [Epithele typhae]|uniref:uncharacterized protein n=1 Tax=Epithele typhae TaxID=378194 RepID=UPI00200735CB|nr:uncharacterized protein BXZ73DRAFT_107364 [Epithele typhae]KAH9912634.1 hypothetical protein BXZ73DRAFT_107364 [Epithele typhae]